MNYRQGPHWLKYGDPAQSSSFTGDLAGKYLIFCDDQSKLCKIAEDEINNHGFSVAKVSVSAINRDYVLCLYWTNDSRKSELAQRYAGREDVSYRYWKSNRNTRNGVYSQQYLR